MAIETPTGAEAEKLLKELRERYDLAVEHWQPIQRNGTLNMRYVSGDPWDPKERKAREDAGRPVVSFDEITQYTNQVINNLRAKRRGVVFTANGDGATDQSAEFYQDKMREIEYRSKAQIVYTTAAQNMVERGYGFARVLPKYASDTTFEQELWLDEIVNPDSVLPDPDAKRPTFSDQKYCFVHEPRKISEFKREFPRAKVTDFDAAVTVAPRWIQGASLILAEYWVVKTIERELVRIKQNGQAANVFAEDVPKAFQQFIVDRRPVEQKRVCMYLTNGVELLETTEWPGQYIPIVGCVGKVIYVDSGAGVEVKYLSMVDLMRDPQMGNAYLRTNEVELVGMSPKTPWVGYTGQFRTRQSQWAKLHHEPVAYIEADPTTESTGTQLLSLPVRTPYEPPIQALEILAESSRRSIQAAAGSMPLPTAAQRRNEKSGVALKEIRETGQVGSYHFSDHYDNFIEQIGVVVEDVMDKFYDTAREVAIRKANDTAAMVRINDPSVKDSVSTKGRHLVTVSTGPSFDSEREAATDLADTLLTHPDPEINRAVLPLAIKLKNLGAIGDELVELTEALQPPAIQMRRQKEGQAPSPQQLMAQIGQLQQQIQHAEAAMQELAKEADGKQLDADTKKFIAQKQGEIDLAKARMDNATKIAVAHIAASAKGVSLDAHAVEEAEALGHEALQNELDRQHERDMAMAAQSHEVAMGGAQADAAAEEADRAREHEATLTDAQIQAQRDQAELAAQQPSES